MEPTINNGNIVFISAVPYVFGKPKRNDIVVFKYKNKHFLKRISKINNHKYEVKGDNAKDSLDSRVFGEISRNQILGKVIFKV